MKRVLTMLVLATSLLVAACGGSGSSAGPSIEPVSLEPAPDMSSEASPDTASPEASPS